MIEKIEKVYIDMDGVLVDFEGGVEKLLGIVPPGGKRPEEEDRLMWKRMKTYEHFYDRLEPMPGAIDMFNRLYERFGDNLEVLTGIPKPERGILTAAEDKTNWVHRVLSKEIKVNPVRRRDKYLFCKGKEYILIDDLKDNIEAWEKAGGTGILHISPDDTMKKIFGL
ncbi:MAG: hypothetical protein IJ757_06440 [Clostridiales bacterium]|nr:hypothetical protein [Clostridiales bacterium]